jgi:hypothetical protein
MLSACIPVIAQDHVEQPLHNVLPYHLFSVRISVAEIPTLLAKLKCVLCVPFLARAAANLLAAPAGTSMRLSGWQCAWPCTSIIVHLFGSLSSMAPRLRRR